MTGLQRTDSRRRRSRAPALRVAAVLAVAVGVSVGLSAAQAPSAQPDLELGKRMYRQGLLPSGQPMRATVQGDVSLTGPQLPCATCHGRSGFGARESAVFVPPITGPSLYRASEAQQAPLFSKLYQARKPLRVQTRMHDPRLRPAYTDATLAIALREGKDPTGRTLDPLMPRYLLGEADLRHLNAYLQSLSATPSPGVTASTIHFATVITDGVEPARRQAMLDVLEGYVRWKNADTIRRVQRSGLSAWYKEVFPETYRVWALHVWQLTGPAETWHDQLNTYYRQQPVFALLSGMGTGAWQPVHDFCEATEVACLFPHTDLPVVAPAGMYTLYLSKGLTVEAKSLAYYLHTTTASDKTARLVQVYRDTESGRTPAHALRQALQAHGSLHLQDQIISDRLTPDFWQTIGQHAPPAVLVLWLGDADMATLERAQGALGAVQQIYLSSSLLQRTPPWFDQGLRDKTYLIYPFALPHHDSPHSYRVRAWLRSRGVQRTYERVQLNTYFALSITDHALMQIGEHLFRDSFIETIEHETESMPNPGVFPHLTLGPGQRFVSTGSYIVRLADQVQGGLEAVSDWIIP